MKTFLLPAPPVIPLPDSLSLTTQMVGAQAPSFYKMMLHLQMAPAHLPEQFKPSLGDCNASCEASATDSCNLYRVWANGERKVCTCSVQM